MINNTSKPCPKQNAYLKFKRWCLLFLCLVPTLMTAALPSATLTSIKSVPLKQKMLLIFTLTAPVHYSTFSSTNPPRLVIDFIDTKSKVVYRSATIQHAWIRSSRIVNDTQHKKLRFIVDWNYPVSHHIQLKKEPHSSLYTLTASLSLMHQALKKPKAAPPSSPVLTHNNNPAIQERTDEIIVPPVHSKSIKTDPTRGLSRKVVVIIDPGHGGKDPGATGARGSHEKDIVLAVAKNLYAFLKEHPGIDPELTRNDDYFVPLRGRLKLARKGRADLFLAIHADAYKNLDARGVTVFALSERGATSEAARWLAQKENYSELGGVELSDKSYLLRSLLLDLSQTATIRDSVQFGYSELQALSKVARLHEPFVEQAPFVVLKSPDIPSLLIETGFISNAEEELLLNNPHYQKQIAKALMEGILSYLHKNQPPGTYFAQAKG